MDTFIHCGMDGTVRRDHPYAFTPLDPESRYVDFKLWPELIPSTLEDFAPVRETAAAGEFFALVRRLNSPDSILETNDCTFKPPGPNSSPDYPMPFESSGRLMLLYRDQPLNQDRQAVALLTEACNFFLREADPSLRWGAVRISHDKMSLGLLRAHGLPSEADQVTLNFWAWGRDPDEVLENARRVFAAISSALDHINAALAAAVGAEEIRRAREAQRALEELTFALTTHARNLPALAASIPPEEIEAVRAGRREAYVKIESVPTHAMRACDSILLCGTSGRDYAQIGGGNAPSIYLQELNLCRRCKSRLRESATALLKEMGLTLSDALALKQAAAS